MSVMELSTPDSARLNSQSALDLAFWASYYATVYYPRTSAVPLFAGDAINEENNLGLIRQVMQQIGMVQPTTYDSFLGKCIPGQVSVAQALRDRGALLFKNRGIAISVGLGNRIIEVNGADIILRTTNITERTDAFWTLAARIPGVTYL